MTALVHQVVDPITIAFMDALEGYVSEIASAVEDIGDGDISRPSFSEIGDEFGDDLY